MSCAGPLLYCRLSVLFSDPIPRHSQITSALPLRFVDADNEHDAVAVRLGVSRGDALHELRARLLERLGVPASGLFYLHREGPPIDGSLFTFLRVFNMDTGV